MHRILSPLVLSSVLLSILGVAPAAAESALQLEEVAEGVYAFFPTPEAFDTWAAISNSGAILLSDGVLVFDSHWDPKLAEEAIGLLRNVTDLPVRYVVSSHFHGDHTGGYWAYDRDVEIISHHATRARLVDEAASLLETLPTEIAQLEAQIPQIEDPAQKARMGNVLQTNRDLLARVQGPRKTPLASLTFEERVVLHRGRTVEIHFLGRGHTDGDAIVVLPDEKLAFLGDLLFTRTLPNVGDGHTREWIETLRAVLELGVETFVPGHGALSTAAEVRAQIDYLEWLRDAVAAFVDSGKTVEDAQAGIALPDRFADFEFAFFLPASVAKVYGELSEGR